MRGMKSLALLFLLAAMTFGAARTGRTSHRHSGTHISKPRKFKTARAHKPRKPRAFKMRVY